MKTHFEATLNDTCFVKIWQLENGKICYKFCAGYCGHELIEPLSMPLDIVVRRVIRKVTFWINQEYERKEIAAKLANNYNTISSLEELKWIKGKLEAYYEELELINN